MTLNVTEYVLPIGIVDTSLRRQLLQIVLIAAAAIILTLISGPQLGKENLQLVDE